MCLDALSGAVKWRSTVAGQPLACCGAASTADRLLVASSYLFVLQNQRVALKLSGHTVCFYLVPPVNTMQLHLATAHQLH